ncbi:Ethanolamine kinase-like Protein [Tribolium castaneum]|uniref:ethanolamine kinase n=1 Tax=Tribolium castaneum TaxID=7070 RepID=D6X535_TRICA|nr:PREDICTED: ethanolamine kinase 2 [Tribolium castaneum]EEZ97183.2 Ethanolamine kinase-like Protein [Tribolium castaneum]|eukprot:XP_008200318.1 PREDICTED: ethanolamine kinase 2 [Tribolium castaneum]
MEEKIPHLSLHVNEDDINAGAARVLAAIRPHWGRRVDFKLLTDGITNKLVGCRGEEGETVLVRVYGNKTDLLIDRKAETRNILLLSRLRLAPSLYATFENGLAYEYVPGCTLSPTMAKNPKIAHLVASHMGKLHKVQVPDISNPQPLLWPKIRNFLDLVPEQFSDITKNERYHKIGAPTKMQLEQEFSFLQRNLSKEKCPIVFCHNDLLLGNVIYNSEKDQVTFIDYEYANYNYQAFDIANHFLEFAGVENVDYGNYPTREFQIFWLGCYLNEFQPDASQSQLELLLNQVDKFTLASHLFWGIWALIQTEHSDIAFDFLGYAVIRFNEYFKKKEQLENLN